MRSAGLAPGGRPPVARVVCRRGRRWAALWDGSELVAKRTPSAAQLDAVRRALAARRWCGRCEQDVGYCIQVSLGLCVDCHAAGRGGGGRG
ncbi:RRQRL motif-containing zinc-binding protein [Actinomycetospora corticicola]